LNRQVFSMAETGSVGGNRVWAMAAGVTDRLWEMADPVTIVESAEAAPKARGAAEPQFGGYPEFWLLEIYLGPRIDRYV
jgi:hypothetical protein